MKANKNVRQQHLQMLASSKRNASNAQYMPKAPKNKQTIM